VNLSMIYRTLGRTGLEVSLIGYGAWGVGGNQWRGHSEDEAYAALRLAQESGVNLIDTALAYNDGHSEQIVGKVAKDAESKVYIATKVPPKNRIWPARAEFAIEDVFPYDYIIESTEQSLCNLGAECIDLQQLHVWNDAWVDRDEWRRAAVDLRRAGKIRHFGISVSDHDPSTVLQACRSGLIDTVQVIYNIYDQSPEAELFPLCQELNIGVLARCPFDEGSLTGKITPETEFDPAEFRAMYFRGERKREVYDRANALKTALEAAGVDETLPETALRFCVAHPVVSTVIPGMRQRRNVEQNLGTLAKGRLTDDARQLLKAHAWTKNFYQ
jgi:aryl-alcohol dehydrogenase-like predicted oxidoreductase